MSSHAIIGVDLVTAHLQDASPILKTETRLLESQKQGSSSKEQADTIQSSTFPTTKRIRFPSIEDRNK